MQRQLTVALANEASSYGWRYVRSVQRRWVAYRNAECTLETEQSAGGTESVQIGDGCFYDLTVAEIRTVQQDTGNYMH